MRRPFIVIALMFCILHQTFAQLKPISKLVTKEIQSPNLSINNLDVTIPSNSKKSVMLAVVASLIVPGMGELYVGSFETGKYHLIAESGLWLTYAGFRIHSNWLRQDAQTFAKEHAGANFTNKNDQYAVNIGNFNTTAEYNDTKSRNREYDLIYFTESYPDYLWNWDSDANRQRFKDIRIHSDQVKNNAKFLIGVVVVNHLISAFSAARKATAYNRSLSMIDDMQIYAYTLNSKSGIDGVGLSFITKF